MVIFLIFTVAITSLHSIFQPLCHRLLEKRERPATCQEKSMFKQQEERAHSTILLSLSNKVLYEVIQKQTSSRLGLKLEKLFMTKSICNKWLKRRIFGLHMKEGMSMKAHFYRLILFIWSHETLT